MKISEEACEACMLRANRCPGDAVRIVKLPTNLDKGVSHRYDENAFKLCGLPDASPGQVTGLLGSNGIGKSTALQILAGRLKPNLGRFDDPPSWTEIFKYYRGSSLQNYLKALANDELRAVSKSQNPQFRHPAMPVRALLEHHDERGVSAEYVEKLDLTYLLDRPLEALSGGERQRVAIACVASKAANVYIFDEPSSFLDVKQRLAVVDVIRSLVQDQVYVFVVEHDLAMLDAVSDAVCCLFGSTGAYGVVTSRMAPGKAINQFLNGFFPTLNMRFRPEPLDFSSPCCEVATTGATGMAYSAETITLEDRENSTSFTLRVEGGEVCAGEVVVLLGENGTGKSTLAEKLAKVNRGVTSYKPQHSTRLRRWDGTVGSLLEHEVPLLGDRMFGLLVAQPLYLDELLHKQVSILSGGELQRVAIAVCLGTPAQLYLLDEPSAGLDCEQRLVVARVLQRWVTGHLGAAALVVEHDLLMAASLAARVVCYDGTPGVECTARSPALLKEGLNTFMRVLDVTIREDSSTGRPRVNKRHCAKDREQRKAGMYYRHREDTP